MILWSPQPNLVHILAMLGLDLAAQRIRKRPRA